MLKRRTKQAGDTLIEVLLAFSIFGLAATTISRVMNDGFAQMFSSGQQSQIQSLMHGQLAIIQAAHDTEANDPNSTAWDNVINSIAPNGPSKDTDTRAAVNADGCTYSLNKNRIYFDTTSGGSWMQPQTMPAIINPANTAVAATGVTPKPDGTSLWVEAKYTPPITDIATGKQSRGFYDFYVKACWTDKLQRQLKTLLRLYDFTVAAGEGSHL